jgi:2,5-diketo-D-gluconate reductase A
MPANGKYLETWRTFETFAADGRATSIGVSNFMIEHLETLIAESGTVPAVNQVELHPIFQQRELRAFHDRHGIRTEAWGPLGQGKYELFTLPAIADAEAEHGVAPAQVGLRWHIQTGNIVIPKSNARERMGQNFDVFGFELDAAQMAAIDALDENRRVGGDPL